ncbi:hypothetical protein [Paraburkholderia caledonica]|uniref:hypothetical protein n=1 Tax=Paraburkholderia caledonica TaxID=134536 RepID=UPI0038BC69E3
MLDFALMSYWRKLFIVVLLALSLPIQSFAAVAMKCAAAEARESTPVHHHAMHAALNVDQQHDPQRHQQQHHDGHAMPVADQSYADGHQPGDHHLVGQHAHSCSTCASCCFGAAMLSVPALPASSQVVDSFQPAPHPTPAASFLTGGIERPPRSILV